MNLFVNFFSSILTLIYSTVGNLGFSIIIFTILIRLFLLPITIPSIKSSKKIQELQPEIKKLKDKFGKDKQGLALAQAQLYKAYNINPLAGCIPQLLQLFILIVLYQVIRNLFSHPELEYNLSFLWTTLSERDNTYVLPVLAGLTQFLLSIMIIPATQTRDMIKNKKDSLENKKEEDIAEMAATMQQQMIFMMPIMTAVIATSLPSGLALYWIAGTIFTIVTQYFISGWGGFAVYWNRYAIKIPVLAKVILIESKAKLTAEPKKKLINKTSFLSKISGSSVKQSESLATVLQQLDGSDQALKTKNRRATKSKKEFRKHHKIVNK